MVSKNKELQIYSEQLLKNNPSILKSRKILSLSEIFKDIKSFEEIKYNINKIAYLKKDFLFLKSMSAVYCPHDYRIDHCVKWHMDDAYIINHNKNIYNQIKINERKSIYYPDKKPIYNLIIYGSSYKKDFKGGVFEFSDGTKIKPQKNMCLLFNSKEAYRIHSIKSGVIESLLIKFYRI